MGQKKKGSDKERDLVNIFDNKGFGVMRSPGSGGGTEREQPDLLIGSDEREVIISIEAKASAGNYIYLEEEEVENLKSFSNKFGVDKVRIGFRFNYKEWKFFNPNELYRTNSGKYRIKKERVDEGEDIEELINN